MSIAPTSEIVLIHVEEELKRSYLDYAMSVIVSRALPDVRDGLKPVHRRILYTMMEAGFDYDKVHRKSAHVVGQVVAKYHPHGTDPVYHAMVRMAQEFAMRDPLVDGHGNFGSMDGDEPAAMRYTEARLSHLAHFVLVDYDKDTVDFQPNYDDTLQMPVVLPARFPNLLVNGASGIAVGMATNIPPHHLGEVIDACCLMIDDPAVPLEALLQCVQGPDFPTGGIILGIDGIQEAYRTGRGSFTVRGKCNIETMHKGREAIIVTEIPYQVNKATMVERIAELVHQKELEGIVYLRDESDRHGVRVVIELKKDANADVILNRLYAMTPLQISFSINMLAIHQERPVQLTLTEALKAFIDFRRDVVVRRTQHYLFKARQKSQIILGLAVAVSHIDQVIILIKAARDTADACAQLQERIWPTDGILRQYLERLTSQADTLPEGGYRLSEEQAKAILALRLQRLTGIERDNLFNDLEKLCQDIIGYLTLLDSKEKIFALITSELLDIKQRFATPRRTEISHESLVTHAEDLIPCEDMVVTVSLKGYIKRTPLSAYRSQRHGGRGRNAMVTREEDEVANVFVADTHTRLLCFTSLGQAYQLKVYELPLGLGAVRGKPLISLFPLQKEESLATLLPLPKEEKDQTSHIVFITSQGNIRKNALSDFLSIRSNGKIAIRLDQEERLVGVSLVNEDQDILLSSRFGKSIRFSSQQLRQFSSRQSTGVRGMSLKKGDEIVSMSIVSSLVHSSEEIEKYLRYIAYRRKEEGEDPLTFTVTPEEQVLFDQMEKEEQFILSISEGGFGKRTSCYAYRRTGRGGQGVATMDVTERTGLIVNALPVEHNDQILMLTGRGQLMRCPVEQIRISGRKTQGVRIFRLEAGERIASIAILPFEESLEEDALLEEESAQT